MSERLDEIGLASDILLVLVSWGGWIEEISLDERLRASLHPYLKTALIFPWFLYVKIARDLVF